MATGLSRETLEGLMGVMAFRPHLGAVSTPWEPLVNCLSLCLCACCSESWSGSGDEEAPATMKFALERRGQTGRDGAEDYDFSLKEKSKCNILVGRWGKWYL